MLDEEEWRWAEAQLSSDVDHLHVVSTLPVLLPPTLHYVEAWNEAVCDGAWGKLAARIGEKVRRAIDLEHWAAFQDSFHRLVRTLEELASCRRGRPPASIVLLGGDIHQAWPRWRSATRPARKAASTRRSAPRSGYHSQSAN